MPNPVLRRFNETVDRSQVAGPPPSAPTANDLQRIYQQPTYTGPAPDNAVGGYPPAPPGAGGYAGFGVAPTAPSRYLTLDDVVIRTGAMLGTILLFGAFTWVLTDTANVGLPVIVGMFGGLGLGLYISFSGKANAVTTLLYAALQGVALGGISKLFEQRWPGIVVQAVLGTVMVAGGVLVVYKTGVIRVTPRLTRMVFAATLGALGLMLVNGLASLVVDGGLGLRNGGGIAILFSLVCIAVASFNLIVDFDGIEQAIRRGADEKYAWYASFGIIVTLVWLYLEILRLLSYLQRD
ncbi:MAG: Bax inhibitor-1/YccA family protein [Frankiaceae bacterium]|jgi:uncharacterized YccA/Bax inhibitor family protein|nr:Bax inhibitor-1/YccA family protein [Frankiaceae bacterium]